MRSIVLYGVVKGVARPGGSGHRPSQKRTVQVNSERSGSRRLHTNIEPTNHIRPVGSGCGEVVFTVVVVIGEGLERLELHVAVDEGQVHDRLDRVMQEVVDVVLPDRKFLGPGPLPADLGRQDL